MGSESLQKLSAVLTEQEIEVLQMKYAGLKISQMDESEVLQKSFVLLTRIHIITGWNLPNDSDYIKVLGDELKIFLSTKFFDLNFEEVVFAFRTYGIGTIDWGKNMNLTLISDCLNEYLLKRYDVSLIEERIKVKQEQVLYDAEQLRNIQREDIENFYQRLLLGREVLENAADWFKDVLVYDGLMTERDHLPQFFFTRAYGGSKNIYVKNGG